MSETEFRVTVDGPPNAAEQFKHLLRKVQSEAEHKGVSVDVEEINTEDLEATFRTGSETRE